MPRLQFKKKCGLCRTNYTLAVGREYPVCKECHMKQIFSEEITDKKYKFLNIDRSLYEQSKFLRNIRNSYIRFKELSDKQISTFKKVVKDLKSGKIAEDNS